MAHQFRRHPADSRSLPHHRHPPIPLHFHGLCLRAARGASAGDRTRRRTNARKRLRDEQDRGREAGPRRRLARSADDLPPGHHRGRLADGLYGHLPRLLRAGEAGPHPGQPDGAGVDGRPAAGSRSGAVGRGTQEPGAGGLGFGRVRAHFLPARSITAAPTTW